jgi:hypothetical protein
LAGRRLLFELAQAHCPKIPVRYSLLMAVSADLRRDAQEAARRLASMAPEASMQAAALLREVKPRLIDDRERGVAEEMARRFEGRAGARSRSAIV